jgi:hypothetical protein
MEILYACVNAIKSVFDTSSSVPLDTYFHLPISYWSCIGYSLVVLSKIWALRGDGPGTASSSVGSHACWDLDQIKNKANLGDILNELVQKFKAIKMANGFDPPTTQGKDMFSKFAATFGRLAPLYESRLVDKENSLPECLEVPATAQDVVAGNLYSDFGEEFLDFMGDWETF